MVSLVTTVVVVVAGIVIKLEGNFKVKKNVFFLVTVVVVPPLYQFDW